MRPHDNEEYEKRYSKSDLKKMAVCRYMGLSIAGYVLLFVCHTHALFPPCFPFLSLTCDQRTIT